MIIISHRGNTRGPNPEFENHPSYVDQALLEHQVEVDIHCNNGEFWLGHDSPQYKINLEWLIKRKNKLWIHCKNISAAQILSVYRKEEFNFFGHSNDKYVVSSNGYVLSIGCFVNNEKTIIVMPEVFSVKLNSCFVGGVMTDYANEIQRLY